ncbi:hypothetical protein Hanom_Chr02g00130681 [Helianthus anomalus]
MDVLEDMIKKIVYDFGLVFYIHFKEPYVCLDFGLRTLRCDNDLEAMYDHVLTRVKLINIYVEHWRSTMMLH